MKRNKVLAAIAEMGGWIPKYQNSLSMDGTGDEVTKEPK